jgi:hypothetical protein
MVMFYLASKRRIAMATVMAKLEKSVTEETHQNEVTLIVPSNGDATRLREFTEKFKQIFGARILGIIGSWEQTLITVEIDKMITIESMLDQLVNMREVESVQEKQIKNHNGNHEGILVILANPK